MEVTDLDLYEIRLEVIARELLQGLEKIFPEQHPNGKIPPDGADLLPSG
jgi:hypothetical protein